MLGVVYDEGLKIKSCKGGWLEQGEGRVLVCSTFSRHLTDEFHLDGLQEAAAATATASCGLSNAFYDSVSAPRHGLLYCLVNRRYVCT
jgi:hypothetical protein